MLEEGYLEGTCAMFDGGGCRGEILHHGWLVIAVIELHLSQLARSGFCPSVQVVFGELELGGE